MFFFLFNFLKNILINNENKNRNEIFHNNFPIIKQILNNKVKQKLNQTFLKNETKIIIMKINKKE